MSQIIGVTENGKPVVSGRLLFGMKDANGMPLEMSLETVIERGGVVNWLYFIDAAREVGWPDFRTYKVIGEALIDADVPVVDRVEIEKRLMMYLVPGCFA